MTMASIVVGSCQVTGVFSPTPISASPAAVRSASSRSSAQLIRVSDSSIRAMASGDATALASTSSQIVAAVSGVLTLSPLRGASAPNRLGVRVVAQLLGSAGVSSVLLASLVLKQRVVGQEDQSAGAGGPGAVLGDVHLGQPGIGRVGVVNLVAV